MALLEPEGHMLPMFHMQSGTAAVAIRAKTDSTIATAQPAACGLGVFSTAAAGVSSSTAVAGVSSLMIVAGDSSCPHGIGGCGLAVQNY
jgi:hypothetical protein